ncbi:MAG: hypothetical protein E7607_05610 [Ruminococcaceae bacterium]|nr:hypothetical protein [Oscillospiraceae bacterium]
MKKLLIFMLAILLCLGTSVVLISCDDKQDATESTPTEGTPTKDTWAGLSAEDSLDKLDNYTLTIEGKMSVTQNGQAEGVSDMKQVTKIADGKIEIILYGKNENGEMEPAEDSMILDGEMAQSQKTQNNQLIGVILGEYENFVYDSETDSYSITETIVVEKEMDGFSMDPSTGNMVPIKVDTKITIKNAKVNLTQDGKLAILVCDYTQEMNMGGQITTTGGLTTWTVTDYGTTVIG